MIVGIAQLFGSFILYFFRRYFTLRLAGLIFFGLGIWGSALGISELFHPVGLGQIILHGATQNSRFQLQPALLGILVLIIMLTCMMLKRLRNVCVLIGVIIGWIIGAIFGFIPNDHVAILKNTPWFTYPHFWHPINFVFSLKAYVFLISLGFYSSIILFALITILRKENYKDWEARNLQACIKGNLAISIGAIITSFLGGFPATPPHGSVAGLIATQAYSRRIAYVCATILFIFAFIPKFAVFFITMPATVNGAVIILMGGIMCAKSFKYINFNQLSSSQLKAYSYAIILLVITDVTPTLYQLKFLTFFIPNGLVVGLIALILLTLLFSLNRHEKTSQPS